MNSLNEKYLETESISQYFNKVLKSNSLKFLLNSIKTIVIDFLQSKHPLRKFKNRPNGISLLLPTQNEELTVKLSILSLIDFADEIIIVDNGSIDNTKEIIKEIAQNYQKIRFFDKPELPDLYHNRRFAVRQSKYRWVCRFDSDYIAYTKGKNSILKLRKILLNLPKGVIPKVISLYKLNLDGDFWHTRKDKFSSTGEIIRGPEMRIYEYFPFFTFGQFGRREYATFQKFLRNYIFKTIFYMHCTIKSEMNLFLRSERANWRGQKNYKNYPTLLSYIQNIITTKYNTTNLKIAMQKFMNTVIYKKENYIKYNPELYLPYPSLILKEMEKDDVFRIDKYLI